MIYYNNLLEYAETESITPSRMTNRLIGRSKALIAICKINQI